MKSLTNYDILGKFSDRMAPASVVPILVSASLYEVRVRVMGFKAISIMFQLNRGGQFYRWTKPEDQRKPPICLMSLTNFII